MRAFVWKTSLYRFLDAFKLVALIFTLLFAENGLSVFQVSILVVIWSVSQMLFEIPMGVVADKYSRRNVLIAASVIVAIGFSLWLFGGFLFYALGMILYGLRNALVSGTQEAFVYDELKSLGKDSEYANVSGKLDGSMQMGFMLSAILGGIVGQFSFNLAIILSIITSLFSAGVLLTIKAVSPIQSMGEVGYFKVLKRAIKEIHSNSKILMAIIFIACTFGIAGAGDKYFPLVFKDLGINTAFIGSLIALEVGMFALSGYTFPWWNKLKNNYWQYLLIIASGVLFIIFGLGNSLVLLPLVFISSYIGKLALVKLDVDLQDQVSSEQRATVLSIKGLIFEIIFLVATLFFGYVSSQLGVISTISIWGGFYILWTLLFIRPIRQTLVI
jgi:MFS family permease